MAVLQLAKSVNQLIGSNEVFSPGWVSGLTLAG